MKKLYFIIFLFCAGFCVAQDFELPPNITDMNIHVEILADIAVTRYDIASTNDGVAQRIQLTKKEKLKNEDSGFLYTLPLEYNQKIPSFSLRVDAEQQETAPEIKENPFENFNFARRDYSYTATFKAKDYKLSAPLSFTIPAEDAVKIYTFDEGGNTYFLAAVTVPASRAGLTLHSITYDKNKFEVVYPDKPLPARDIMTLSGILDVKDARLELKFTDNKGKDAGQKRVYINKKYNSPTARIVFEQMKADAADARETD